MVEWYSSTFFSFASCWAFKGFPSLKLCSFQGWVCGCSSIDTFVVSQVWQTTNCCWCEQRRHIVQEEGDKRCSAHRPWTADRSGVSTRSTVEIQGNDRSPVPIQLKLVGLTPSCFSALFLATESFVISYVFSMPFAVRQMQMNPIKPSFDMTMLYSYMNECTLNTIPTVAFVINIQPKNLDS